MAKRSPAKSNLRHQRKELLEAINAQQLDRVEALLAANPALANAQNSHHNVPLSDAIGTGNLELVQLLIAHGANPDHRNHGGRSLLDTAALTGELEIARYLIAQGAVPTVHHAAAVGDLEWLDRLIDEDPARLGVTQASGRWQLSPLHAAATAGNVESIQHLLQRGAEVDAKNHNEHTPLGIVPDSPRAAHRVEVAELLLAAGADPNAASGHHGGVALHRAVMNNDLPLARVLLEHRADPNRQDWSDRTPLHHAVSKNRELVALLLEYRPDLTLRSMDDETPAEYAQRLNNQAVAALLES